MESILHIQEKYRVDDPIKSYEYNEYHPTSGSNLNMAGQNNINIEIKMNGITLEGVYYWWKEI